MTFLHFFPEFLLASLIFGALMLMSLRTLSQGVLPLWISTLALGGLVFFVFRTDLAAFESGIPLIRSDSLSYFGRLISLLALSVFGLGVYFHPGLNVREKQTATLFLLFLSVFLNALVLSQSVVLFISAAIGIHFCGANLILIESKGSNSWLKVLRAGSAPVAMTWVLGLLFFLASVHLFRSVFFSGWVDALGAMGPDWGREVFLVILVLSGVLPLLNLRNYGQAPFSLGVAAFGSLLVLEVFWFRMGVPVLGASQILTKPAARILLALLFGGISLRPVVAAVRSRDHDTWVSSFFPIWVGIGLFTVLLPSDQSLPAFQIVLTCLLLTFPLVSRAFLDREYRIKSFGVFALIAALGAPPFVLGEQIYRMIKELLGARDFAAGVLLGLLWFGLTLAAIQIIGKVLLVRIASGRKRRLEPGDWFFLLLYISGMIGLTAFQGPLTALLNDHPLLNLW